MLPCPAPGSTLVQTFQLQLSSWTFMLFPVDQDRCDLTHMYINNPSNKKKKERKTLNIQFRHIYRLVSKRGYCVSLCSRDCSKDIIIKTVISQDFLWIFNMFCWLLNILIMFSAIFYFIIYIYYMAKYVSAKPQMTWNFTMILTDICVLSAVVNPPQVEKKDPIQRSENATFCPKKLF